MATLHSTERAAEPWSFLRKGILDALADAAARGILVVALTQCATGSVLLGKYAVGWSFSCLLFWDTLLRCTLSQACCNLSRLFWSSSCKRAACQGWLAWSKISLQIRWCSEGSRCVFRWRHDIRGCFCKDCLPHGERRPHHQGPLHIAMHRGVNWPHKHIWEEQGDGCSQSWH